MLSNLKRIAERQKRNTLRDAIAGAAIMLLIGFQAVAFSESSRSTVEALAADTPVQTQVEVPIAPEQLICTPESVAVVC